MATVVGSRIKPEGDDEHSTSGSKDFLGEAHQPNQELPPSSHLTDDAEDPSAIQTKLFKRRRKASASAAASPEAALPPKCCMRCKSDLNGKLMVRCATCSFRCHLYCFSPPLKQHPGFLIRKQQSLSHSDTVQPSWNCDKCSGTSVVYNVKPIPSSNGSLNKKITRLAVRHNDRVSIDTRGLAIEISTEVEANDVTDTEYQNLAQQVQPEWLQDSKVTFDWYRFRSHKAEALRHYKQKEGQYRSGLDDLVFYSRSYALIKKTAAIWRAYAKRRKDSRIHEAREMQALQYLGIRRKVTSTSTPIHEDTPAVPHKLVVNEEDELDDLNFDDAYQRPYISFSRRPPALPLLWKGDPPSALLCWTTGERQEVTEALRELVELVCMARQDHDTLTAQITVVENDKIVGIIDTARSGDVSNEKDKSGEAASMNFYTSGKIIFRLLSYQHRWRRGFERAQRMRRAIEETKRRAKAQASLTVVRICIQFIMQLMKKLGEVHTKKALLLVLRDAAEDTQTKNTAPKETDDKKPQELTHERKESLAKMHICRFFVRRVHPYVKLKKLVMTRRLQHWWKYTYISQKWREVAVSLRLQHQELSCLRIQRFYRLCRHQRVQKRIQLLIERLAFKKMRGALAKWVISRLAKKEAKRLSELDTLSSIGSDAGVQLQPVPSDNDIEKQALEFYHVGDFWNAALTLEHFYKNKSGDIPPALQHVLACSHHMTWYQSYDHYNLSRAHELYCALLGISGNKKRPSSVDPSTLQELAIVMMHMEHFGDSLRLLAKLIELFPREPQFTLWLLLAAVQLQQVGQWEQSVGYLTYLQDIPPVPYLERDILLLCAMSYERLSVSTSKTPEERRSYSTFAKEAWHSALRLWSRDEFSVRVLKTTRVQVIGQAFTSKQKWDVLISLGLRALEQGHYLIACRVYTYALDREERMTLNGGARSDQFRYYYEEAPTVWWSLADAFRHLGHIDLYVNAAQHSQTWILQENDNTAAIEESLKTWQDLADGQACSFRRSLQ